MKRDIYIVSLPRPTRDGLKQFGREVTRRMLRDSIKMGGIVPQETAAAAKVFIETHAETAKIAAAVLLLGRKNTPSKFTIVWNDTAEAKHVGGARVEYCADAGAVAHELFRSGNDADEVEAWCRRAAPGQMHEFPGGWIFAREP